MCDFGNIYFIQNNCLWRIKNSFERRIMLKKSKMMCILIAPMILFFIGCITNSNVKRPSPVALFCPGTAGLSFTDDGGFYPIGLVNATEKIKLGEASSYSILSLFAWGDSSINAAMENGKLTKINHIDYVFKRYSIFYSEYTIKVYGE